jgi:DNA-binding transcriptional MerR regulator/methylmalonyl-CoA mutase cobalamin-binding subunit
MISRDVLRAWETRYGLLEPSRSEGGQRLYSDADIERLQLVRRALEAGRRIGQVAKLSREQLEQLVAEDEASQAGVGETGGSGRWSREAERLLRVSLTAVEAFDARGLEVALGQGAVTLPAAEFIEHVVTPLLIGIGDLWTSGRIIPGHERLATMIVRRKLDEIRTAIDNPSGPGLVVTTPSGQQHEIGAMLAAAAAATSGWRVTYLGPDLPAESIARAVHQTEAKAVALSIIFPPDDRGLDGELRELRRLLPGRFPIIVGGRAAAGYQEVLEEIDVIWLPSEPSVRSALGLIKSVLGGRGDELADRA